MSLGFDFISTISVDSIFDYICLFCSYDSDEAAQNPDYHFTITEYTRAVSAPYADFGTNFIDFAVISPHSFQSRL